MSEEEQRGPIRGEKLEPSNDVSWWFDKYLWGHVRIRYLPGDKDKDPILSNKCYFVEDDFALFKNPEDLARFNEEKCPDRIIPPSECGKNAVVIKAGKYLHPSFATDFRVVERASDGCVALEPGEKIISVAEYLIAEDETNQAVKEHWTNDEWVALKKRQFERRRQDNAWEEDWEEGK